METKETKSKKSKKDGIEIRFTVSETDGNLKGMLDKVPNGCYTDFTKNALRYYLKAVRDGEVECDFLKPNALDEFKIDLKAHEPCLNDILKVIQACSNNKVDVGMVAPISAPIVNNIGTNHPLENEKDNSIDISEDDSNIDDDTDYNIEINIDEDDNNEVISEESTQLNTTSFNF